MLTLYVRREYTPKILSRLQRQIANVLYTICSSKSEKRQQLRLEHGNISSSSSISDSSGSSSSSSHSIRKGKQRIKICVSTVPQRDCQVNNARRRRNVKCDCLLHKRMVSASAENVEILHAFS